MVGIAGGPEPAHERGTPVTPVVAVMMIVGGGGAAAHALSDLDAGHPSRSLRADIGLLLAAVLTVVTGLLLRL